MSKRFLVILAVCVLGLVGIYVATSKKADAPTSKTGSSSTSKLSNNVIGKNTKGVQLTEYGDFQCPACGAYHPIVKQVVEKYKNEIQFQFRNFPLQQLHKNARSSARAAEAAAKQNKYWEMHDLLYEQQDAWKDSTTPNVIFEGYASQLGLNTAKFKTDFASTEVNEIINADYAEGTRLEINSTPTFFLQGKKITQSPRDVEGFSKLIDQAIKDAKK
ncbi:MAG: thioredoxin domain-containing protein [Candidatus Saccharibacteria bacterium]|nr:thioredoxin domain-containing protein [Candidatus Saccharibacteria bacterium]